MNNFNGFDELQRNINRLQRNIVGLQGEVSFDELFPPGFMAKYTNFTSFDDLLAKSGFKVETKEDFAHIPDAEWDAFIASTTRFANWEEMLQKAFEDYAKRTVGI